MNISTMTFYVKSTSGFKPLDTMTRKYFVQHTREKNINEDIPCLYRKGCVQLLTLKENKKHRFQLHQSVYISKKWYLPNTWENIWCDIYVKKNNEYQIFYI